MKNNYWQNRFDEQHKLIFDEIYGETQEVLAKYYRRALEATEKDILKLYSFLLEHSEDGKLHPNDWFKYNRYFEIMNGLNERMLELGQKEIKIYNKELLKMYDRVQVELGQYAPLPGGKAIVPSVDMEKSALLSIWCPDGKHWSDRIWEHKAELQQTLEKGLLDCLNRGTSSEELVQTIMERFNVSYHQAKRITKTELAHIQVQSAVDRYKAAGVDMYEFYCVEDERTCEECGKLHGQIFPFLVAEIGTNMPPIHPNCRCTIIPIIEGINDKL